MGNQLKKGIHRRETSCFLSLASRSVKWVVPCLYLLCSSCSNDVKELNHNPSQSIVIDSISPTTAGPAADVFIYGENFSLDKTKVEVSINGKAAPVIGSTLNRIFIVVPKCSDIEGVVSVTIGDVKSNELPFVYKPAKVK